MRYAGLLVGTAALASIAGAGAMGVRVNTTRSMPVGVWLMTGRLDAAARVRRGDPLVFCAPDVEPVREAVARGWIERGLCPRGVEPLVKPVAALAGDVVTVGPGGVAVNGVPIPGTARLDRDGAGRPIPAVEPGRYTVPDGAAWFVSTHDPRSFDSRYFGPVPLANAQASARPVWVWP